MPKPSKLIAVIPLLAALPLLTGCITIAVPSVSPEPVITTDTPPPDDPNTEEPPPPANNTDVTAPGTVLSIGATAVVPFEYTSESGKHDIQVTVTGFRAGSVSDFADFEDSDKKKLADKTPYYVDITAQALGSDLEKLEYASISYNDIGALDQDGDRMSPLTVFGGFDPCKDGNFDKAGALQTCMIYTANSAQTLTSITWQGTDGGYSDIDGQPIVWK